MQMDLTEEDVTKICQRYYSNTKANIQIKDFVLKSCSDNANGFLAIHKYLNCTGQLNGLSFSLSFFLKFLPHLPKHIEYVEGFRAFEKEVSIYEQIIPKCSTISAVKWAPKCYMTRPYDLLVLENLSTTNLPYEMSPGDDGTLNFNHMNVALKTLAAMHATSIALEHNSNHKMPQIFPNCLYENAYPMDEKMNIRRIGLENAVQVMCELIKYIPKYRHLHTWIEPKLQYTFRRIFQFSQPSLTFRNVFSHGDLWKNNILFQYAEPNDGRCLEQTPIDAILVDFQLARYAPPALDILTLITLTSNSDFRIKHLESLLNGYYDCLAHELKLFDINIEMEISKLEFLESCEYFQLAGLLENCLFGHLILLPKELQSTLLSTSENFDKFIRETDVRVNICCKAFEMDANYRYRLSDTLMCIVDKFILNDNVPMEKML